MPVRYDFYGPREPIVIFLYETRSKIRGTFLFHGHGKIVDFQVSLYRHVCTFFRSKFHEEFEYATFNANGGSEIFFNRFT